MYMYVYMHAVGTIFITLKKKEKKVGVQGEILLFKTEPN